LPNAQSGLKGEGGIGTTREAFRRIKAPFIVAGVVACGVVAIGAGAAVAVPDLVASTGVSSVPGGPPEQLPAPTYAVNTNGDTYGSAADSDAPGNEPDLIRAVATNGKEGYVKKTELEEADGTAASRGFTSPEDALRWQEANRGDRYVPVYEVDGETVIGEFLIARPRS